jgi:hypothetical protein
VRLLGLFLASAAGAVALIAAINWWVDPFGEFAKPAAVRALERRPGCLISRELDGNAQLPFKLALFRSRPTRTIALGTSRVATIPARPGETSFSNLAILDAHPSDLLWLARRLPATRRLTVYVGVEAYWFNPHSGHHDFDPGVPNEAGYLISWSTFTESLHLLRGDPAALTHRWSYADVNGHCVIGHGLTGDHAWRADGTFVWRDQLDNPPQPVPAVTVKALEGTFFANYTALAQKPMHDLERLLALARARDWKVVGFATPYPEAFVRAFLANPQIAARWREFGQVIPALFRRYDDPFLDLRNAARIPCTQSEFVDRGFHVDRACAVRIRGRLDLAARGS